MTRRIETWKIYGRVSVFRNPKGRFVSWHQIRPRGTSRRREAWARRAKAQFGKRVAVYGTTVNRKGVRRKNRIELYGSGRNQYQAIKKLHEGWVPKEPYHVIDAFDIDDFIERGEWEKIEVKS